MYFVELFEGGRVVLLVGSKDREIDIVSCNLDGDCVGTEDKIVGIPVGT